jgi:hypothetical protein
MGDLELTAMLERAAADPTDDFVERMLTLQSERATSPSESSSRTKSYITRPSTARSPRRFMLASAAAALVVITGVVIAIRSGDQNSVAPATDPGGLSVEIDGEPVPQSTLDAAFDKVEARAQELGLGPYEVQVEVASSALANRFFGDLGRSEGAPISDADIDEVVDGAESIERRGRILTPDEITADPELRAEVAAGLTVTRGIGVLSLQLGSPGEGSEAEARWRAWFTEQLQEHSVVVKVDGTEIDHLTLTHAALFLGPA